MKKEFILSLKMLGIMTLLLGIIYPLLITGFAQIVYKDKANGSLIVRNGKVIGSALIGQSIENDRYFASRPSAIEYNPFPSGASNLGLTSNKLWMQIMDRKEKFIIKNGLDKNAKVPSEMVFASGSGLDPHISPEAAFLQMNRIASARGLSGEQKQQLYVLIKESIEQPQFHVLGEERVNVFLLNLKLDESYR